ncbi:hypothetical protein D9M68_614520 [compost metagenome]
MTWCLASSGNRMSLRMLYWRVTCSCTSSLMRAIAWCGSRPSAPACSRAKVICFFRPATRISKNSSRLLEKISRNFRRSSNG